MAGVKVWYWVYFHDMVTWLAHISYTCLTITTDGFTTDFGQGIFCSLMTAGFMRRTSSLQGVVCHGFWAGHPERPRETMQAGSRPLEEVFGIDFGQGAGFSATSENFVPSHKISWIGRFSHHRCAEPTLRLCTAMMTNLPIPPSFV
ncbi:hypothetical protein CENSYa_1524 [Cenarchaeum symbiosum A]|uniref:Uncharacterized protein n=1 Tax=Cenarchaeum symbiosum (strain A) TaxID=414004 RepID=A0RXS9_CENSY|nr:hypothetical protein CENSYa_1524 [Cenarchaeum symbiosum A]